MFSLNKLEEYLVIFFIKQFHRYGYVGHITKENFFNELINDGLPQIYSYNNFWEAMKFLKKYGYISYEEFDESLPGIWGFKPNISQCNDYLDSLPISKRTIINIIYR